MLSNCKFELTSKHAIKLNKTTLNEIYRMLKFCTNSSGWNADSN